ncbi:MAG: hypothetical protein ACI841_003085 [Planctomycetota bacterium]|jgi:hypothetical protein
MVITLLASLTALLSWQQVGGDESLFRDQVGPLLAERCLPCHSDEQREGELTFVAFDEPSRWLKAGDPDASLMIQMVSGDAPLMPKNHDPLSAGEVAVLREWIQAGAHWTAGVVENELWWSLEQMQTSPAPELPVEWQSWVRRPLDAYVLDSLLASGLEPSPEADRRTLLRRLSFDLIGLPPTPAEMASFLADELPEAYESVVNRLLASPHYGERWARHWLDVVHYADTHGYDKDKPRPNAWPYRDYVIRALNEDISWREFIIEQIAGDVLRKSSIGGSAVVATGMLAAGPWDYVGHVELREGTLDKQKTRNLDRDDIVTNVFSSFQSLTVQCARCHDHKFDPIPQKDYYNLQAVFAGLERVERGYDFDPETARSRVSSQAVLNVLDIRSASEARQLDQLLEEDPRPSTVNLRGERDRLRDALAPVDRSKALGFHSAIEPLPEAEKWVQVELGQAFSLDRVRVFPCDESFGGHPGPGFGLPALLELEVLTGEGWEPSGSWRGAEAEVGHRDRPIDFELKRDPAREASAVRIRAPYLWERTNDFCFALAELEVWADGINVAAGATVTATDSIEAGERWGLRFLVDGKYPWTPEMTELEGVESHLQLLRAELESEYERMSRLDDKRSITRLEEKLSNLPPEERVYAVAREFTPEGSFTPPPEGNPRPIHRLERGEVSQGRELARPAALSALTHASTSFARVGLTAEDFEGSTRVAFAEWVAHGRNPLTWRSIVNRVWHYHFGRGIVETPNDFGRMGKRPTHPRLLDRLATDFRNSGGSLKALHRLIVTSATYRQASLQSGQSQAVQGTAKDSSNRLLWRANRRRLESEALRDAILAVSGELSLEAGGPGFQAFAFEDDHSPRYLYEEVDLNDESINRRSIYRFVVRSVPDPWMVAFDSADPSHCTAVRSDTTTPLQALALLNDPFVLKQADAFAARVRAESDTSNCVRRAVELAWQRSPTADELQLLQRHEELHGLEAVCRVLFNTNEFLYVD